LAQVNRVIIDIKTTKKVVTDNVRKINLYTNNMVETSARLQETKDFIDNTKITLTRLLPAIFILQNEYTNQAGNIDDLKLLLQ
jgi:hypothetical protein